MRFLRTNLCCCVVNDLLRGHVTFVANQQFVDIFTGITVDFSKPLANIVERLLSIDTITTQNLKCSEIPTAANKKSSNNYSLLFTSY